MLRVTTASVRPDGRAAYDRYAPAVIPLIHAAGATVDVRATFREGLEGDDFPPLVAVMTVPSGEAARAMFASAAYRAAIPDRERAFTGLRTFLCDAL